MAGAACRDDAGRRRQPRIVAHAVDATARFHRIRVDSHQRRAPAATARRHGRHRSVEPHYRRLHRAPRASAVGLARGRGRTTLERRAGGWHWYGIHAGRRHRQGGTVAVLTAVAAPRRFAGGPTVTPVIWLVYAGLLGACIGSFLNVVIYRLPLGQSLVSPPSRCPQCGYRLAWYDNVPIVGWLLLGGRCRKCRNRISIQYPLVELITALLFLLVVWLTPPGPLMVSRLLFAGILIALFGIDLEHQILPNSITLPGIVAGLLLSVIAPPGLRDALIGAVLGAGILYAIAWAYYLWRREEGLGMGDVKMLAMIGAFLGWKAVLVTLVLSSFAGALIGVALIAAQRGGMKLALPFGTFLALGALVAMLAGEPLVNWYAGYLLP